MQFTYTPELRELRDRARRLTKEIHPSEEQCEAAGGLSAGKRELGTWLDSGSMAEAAHV